MVKKSLLCLLLALSLLVGSGVSALGGRYPEKVHLAVDYADMLPVTPFDETALLEALNELERLSGRHEPQGANSETRQQLQGLYNEILAELDVLSTKLSLADIQYSAGGGAEADAALYLELSGQQTRLFDLCYQSFGGLAASPYRDILDDRAGEGTAQSLLGYQGISEEEAVLQEEEERLVQEYDQISAKGVPVEVDGQVWTLEALDSAVLDDETYDAILLELWAEQEQAAGEVYRKLLRLRADIAEQAGFDSYPDYAHRVLYGRDYEAEDIAALREAAKTYILPLQLRLLDDLGEKDLRALSVRSRKSGEEMLDDIQPFLQDFDREMADAFRFMREHHLYDIEYGAEKLPVMYTAGLPAYGSAFIFGSPAGNYRDYQDYGNLVHEFGHFNETFYSTQHDLWSSFNIDVGEIDAQALALIFTGFAGEVFGENCAETYTKVVLYDILDSVLDGCLYDEFQEAAFQDPDMSVEELNRLFLRLSEEYGYQYDRGVEEDPSWVEIPHNFQTPFYYISYATSALSALDLWGRYLEWPREAKEIYLDLTALSLSLPYREAVAEVGLRDIFDSGTVPALAEELESYLDGKEVAPARGRHPVLLVIMECAAVLFILFCVVLIVRLTRFLNRNNGWASRPPSRGGGATERDPWSQQERKPPWEF